MKMIYSMNRDEILKNVLDSMQPAEEMGGPNGEDYLNLMLAIKDEVDTRIAAYYYQEDTEE